MNGEIHKRTFWWHKFLNLFLKNVKYSKYQYIEKLTIQIDSVRYKELYTLYRGNIACLSINDVLTVIAHIQFVSIFFLQTSEF
jgi:hypothetical protein